MTVSRNVALLCSLCLSNLGDGGLQLDARSAVKRMQDQEPSVTDVGPAMFSASQVLECTAHTHRRQRGEI